jgi:hypothetical protein
VLLPQPLQQVGVAVAQGTHSQARRCILVDGQHVCAHSQANDPDSDFFAHQDSYREKWYVRSGKREGGETPAPVAFSTLDASQCDAPHQIALEYEEDDEGGISASTELAITFE